MKWGEPRPGRGIFISKPGGGAVVYKLDFERPLRGLWVLARADAICGGPASTHLEVSRDGNRWEHADTLSWYHKVDWRHANLWASAGNPHIVVHEPCMCACAWSRMPGIKTPM